MTEAHSKLTWYDSTINGEWSHCARHPRRQLLAFALEGGRVSIVNTQGDEIRNLDFSNSIVNGLSWHPSKFFLAIATGAGMIPSSLLLLLKSLHSLYLLSLRKMKIF